MHLFYASVESAVAILQHFGRLGRLIAFCLLAVDGSTLKVAYPYSPSTLNNQLSSATALDTDRDIRQLTPFHFYVCKTSAQHAKVLLGYNIYLKMFQTHVSDYNTRA